IPQERLIFAKQALQQREARLAVLRTLPTPSQKDARQTRSERKIPDPRLEFQKESTPKSPTPPPVVEEEISFDPLESSNISEMMKAEVKYEISIPEFIDDMEIEEVLEEEAKQDQKMEIVKHELKIETPTFKFQPYVLPPPETLPEEQCLSFIKTTLGNILEIESKLSSEAKGNRSNVVLTTLSNGQRMTKAQLHVMAVRLLTRGLEFSDDTTEKINDKLREMILQYILEDFKNRMEFALTWLDEEWFHDSIKLREDPTHKSNYVNWLSRLLDRIMPALEDRTYTQFLLDIPELVEDVVDRIKIFCNDPDRFDEKEILFSSCELIDLRPPARSFCMKILLAYCLHKDDNTRASAIIAANKWYPNHPELSQEIESFALESLKQLCDENLPPLFDYHYHVSGTVDTRIIVEDNSETRKWNQQDVDRYINLFFSLCAKKNELFREYGFVVAYDLTNFTRSTIESKHSSLLLRLISVYIQTSEPMQVMIRKNAQKIIDTIGLPGLLQLFRTFPNGAEDLVLKMLVVFTNKAGPPPAQLINISKTVITQRNLDGRFLFPIISYFEKDEIFRYLPKVITTLDATDKQRDIVKKVFLKILTPPTGGVAQITPRELLIYLHQIDKNEVSIKQSVEAIHICFLLPNIFNQQILGAVLQHLSDQSELPTTFMRTVTLSVRAHHTLAGFVNDMLIRKVTDVWKNETQIQDILKQRDPALLKALKRSMENLKPDQRSRVPQYLLELLEIGA
ncbi:11050_t:CDS:10, partial [Acaulospora morrowiae]